MTDRCIDGRLMRHKPFPDDPDYEHDVGECPECGGKGCDRPDIVARLRRLGVDNENEYDMEVCGRAADRIEALEKALREMVYETTHLSPLEPDGSHRCRISAATLETARAALSPTTPPRAEGER